MTCGVSSRCSTTKLESRGDPFEAWEDQTRYLRGPQVAHLALCRCPQSRTESVSLSVTVLQTACFNHLHRHRSGRFHDCRLILPHCCSTGQGRGSVELDPVLNAYHRQPKLTREDNSWASFLAHPFRHAPRESASLRETESNCRSRLMRPRRNHLRSIPHQALFNCTHAGIRSVGQPPALRRR